MSTISLLRAAAAVLGLVLAGRTGRRFAAVLAGALAAFAVLGPARRAFPGPAEAAILGGALALLLALGARRAFPSITGEAAGFAALAAGGAAAVAVVSGRSLSGAETAALAMLALLSVSAFAAESCLAGGEAGWREGLARVIGVGLPAALGASLSAALEAAGRSRAGWVVAAAFVVAVLVWFPAIAAESRRVRVELAAEALTGLLTDEDAAALRLPWTRGFEKRFGRTDERREYVRSALLLAAARHQQRRRTGEAVRLRQLEVLTFRTRLRRTQDARATRFERSESGEFTPQTPPPDS